MTAYREVSENRSMNEAIALRDITPEDAAFLSSVYASTREDELSVTGWSDGQKTAFCQMQFNAQAEYYRIHYSTARFSIILKSGEKAGRLYVNRGAREICIVDIALLPAYRGAGIGTYLLSDLREEARADGKILSIHVEKFNPALEWYERMGFQRVEDKGVYFLLHWTA